MAYREVSVFEIREVLRLWLRGEGFRAITRLSGVDRKTVRRYIGAAVAAGLDREGGEKQLTDALVGEMWLRVRPARPTGHGEAWETLAPETETIKAWVGQGLNLVKVHELLSHQTARGLPRTVNNLAVQALIAAFADGKAIVDESSAKAAVTEVTAE